MICTFTIEPHKLKSLFISALLLVFVQTIAIPIETLCEENCQNLIFMCANVCQVLLFVCFPQRQRHLWSWIGLKCVISLKRGNPTRCETKSITDKQKLFLFYFDYLYFIASCVRLFEILYIQFMKTKHLRVIFLHVSLIQVLMDEQPTMNELRNTKMWI